MDVLLRTPSCVEVIGRKAAILAEDVMHVTCTRKKKERVAMGPKIPAYQIQDHEAVCRALAPLARCCVTVSLAAYIFG